jgi:hypothetical protein
MVFINGSSLLTVFITILVLRFYIIYFKISQIQVTCIKDEPVQASRVGRFEEIQ